MPTLKVDNGFTSGLPGLGTNVPFRDLSEKRVTKAVRDRLRKRYGVPAIEVSCSAELVGPVWQGTCKIDGSRFGYRISR